MATKPAKKSAITRRSFLKGSACGIVSAVAGAGYCDYTVHDTRLEHVELKLDRWHADGLRVGFITDIHVNDPDEMIRARHASELLAATRPDILIFGGDCVNTDNRAGLENIVPSFEPFRTLKCPKLAVFGNHDYACGALDRIEAALVESGFLPLKNETMRFDNYNVACYDDRSWGNRDPDYQPVAEGTIAVLHEPDLTENLPDSLSLQLSGHSHGGQICLPTGVAFHAPYGARKYTRGFYPDPKVPKYVSRGVGTTGFKWRLFCPPEVTLLTLRSAG